MAETTIPGGQTSGVARTPPRSMRDAPRRFMQATEINPRLMGMVVALVLIWVGFHILSGGVFLTPRNLWNLSVQTASVGVMATGMVLVIVSRNIDLSVGSVLGFVAMIMAVAQAKYLPQWLGLESPLMWIITLAIGLGLGAAIGAFQGFVIAYIGVPSFIVTLGGLLVWRGAAWWVASGQTIAPLDSTFQLLGGGAHGSLGDTLSWAFGVLVCIGVVYLIVNSRRQRRRFDFPLRPVWAEVLVGVLGCAAVLGAVWIANSYPWPAGLAREYAKQNNIAWPVGGLNIPMGIALPVLILIVVTVAMTFLANRRRFGRYVYSIGGNPEAAELGGINTRWTILKIFALMGVLCAISAAISSARLNAGTNALGTGDELYVIAAAVIGGTSFAGGIGTIPGAILGALVMQSLQSGMQLMNIDTPYQNIVAGVVLVAAVGIDTWYRRRSS
jgi:D-xylose transport system permease protein